MSALGASGVTEISFYFNVPSRTGYACRLLRRAQRQGMALAVTGPVDALNEIDRELWTFAAPEFLAHSWIERAAEVPDVAARDDDLARREPDRRAAARRAAQSRRASTPPASRPSSACSRSCRSTSGDRQAARERWKAYARRGYPIKRHEVAA